MPKPSARITAKTPGEADPTFAALDRHKKLDQEFFAVCRAQDEGRADERDVDIANAAAERAAWRLAKNKPSSITGAAAMLTYITTEPAVGMFDLGETSWHETAFRSVAAALEDIARRAG